MPRGGAREGSGRKEGAMARATEMARDSARSSGKLPHELLLEWAQTGLMDGVPLDMDQRMQASKFAAPYFQPTLSSVEQRGEILHRAVLSSQPIETIDWDHEYGVIGGNEPTTIETTAETTDTNQGNMGTTEGATKSVD